MPRRDFGSSQDRRPLSSRPTISSNRITRTSDSTQVRPIEAPLRGEPLGSVRSCVTDSAERRGLTAGRGADIIPNMMIEPAADRVHLTFRFAEANDAPRVAALVNAAYRGNSGPVGWTTESHLLRGRRVDEAGILALIQAPDSVILLSLDEGEVVGSVHLQKTVEATGYLGMFVVDPARQGGGIGKCFMREAEQTAQRLWGVRRMSMTVVSLRPELMAFYQRRGYQPTGEVVPFPFEDGLSVALVDGIELAVMEKML